MPKIENKILINHDKAHMLLYTSYNAMQGNVTPSLQRARSTSEADTSEGSDRGDAMVKHCKVKQCKNSRAKKLSSQYLWVSHKRMDASELATHPDTTDLRCKCTWKRTNGCQPTGNTFKRNLSELQAYSDCGCRCRWVCGWRGWQADWRSRFTQCTAHRASCK